MDERTFKTLELEALIAILASQVQSPLGRKRDHREDAAHRPYVPPSGSTRGRKDDTLVILEDQGFITEGTEIRLIAQKLPKGASPSDSRFRARISSNPSKPIWDHTGERFRSLTQLSKTLRDEHGALIPQSSFNACLYWCIDGENPERTLASGPGAFGACFVFGLRFTTRPGCTDDPALARGSSRPSWLAR